MYIQTERPKFVRTLPSKISRAREMVENPFRARRGINDSQLYEFVKYFWPVVSNQQFQDNWHIEYVAREVQQVIERVGHRVPKEYDLLINIPPGTTKTIVCSIMAPVWAWTRWYWMRFITASHSADLSLESAEYSRDLVRSIEFQSVYPELDIKEDKDTKGNYKVIKKFYTHPNKLPRISNGGNRFSTSVGTSPMGFHGDVLIWDDAINPKKAVSEREIETANKWISNLSTRKTDKRISVTIGIMQRLHQNDPTGYLLERKKDQLKHICLPGEIRTYLKQLNPPELKSLYINDLLDPGRMPWSVLAEMEADLGQYSYAGQVGQNPTPPGGGMFKVDHFQVRTTAIMEVNFEQVIRYWDKAGTMNAGAYTAGVKIAKLVNGHYLVLDVKRGQWAAEERERIILETAKSDGGNTQVFIEQEGGSGGKESAEGTIRNLAGFAVYADHPTGDKVFRADPYSVQVNNGNVILMSGDWNHLYIDEHRDFPFGKYKDQVDASSGAFNHLAAKRVARRIT